MYFRFILSKSLLLSMIVTAALFSLASPAEAQICLLDPNQSNQCCGDGICGIGENCPLDCAVCGDGVCEGGESCASCPGDCGACTFCGDGICNGTETCRSCSDCQNSCFLSPFQTFYRGENTESIYYSYSFDGIHWQGDYRLGNGAQTRRGPAAAIFNDRMYVFYRGRRSDGIFVSYSDDGSTWFGNHSIGTTAGTERAPAVSVFQDKIYVVTHDSGRDRVLASFSSDGDWWIPFAAVLSPTGSSAKVAPATLIYQNRFYVYFTDLNDWITGVYSEDGVTWEALNSTQEQTRYGVGLTEFQGQVYLAFVGRNSNKVYVQSGTPLGGWSSAVPVLNARAEERPTLATDGNKLVLQWKGENSHKNFYATSTDGVHWTGNVPSKGSTKHGGPFMIHTE